MADDLERLLTGTSVREEFLKLQEQNWGLEAESIPEGAKAVYTNNILIRTLSHLLGRFQEVNQVLQCTNKGLLRVIEADRWRLVYYSGTSTDSWASLSAGGTITFRKLYMRCVTNDILFYPRNVGPQEDDSFPLVAGQGYEVFKGEWKDIQVKSAVALNHGTYHVIAQGDDN